MFSYLFSLSVSQVLAFSFLKVIFSAVFSVRHCLKMLVAIRLGTVDGLFCMEIQSPFGGTLMMKTRYLIIDDYAKDGGSDVV